jgi:hypothetical protein
MNRRRGIADEQPASLGGWLFADLFLLLIVVGFSAFTSNGNDLRPVVVTEKASAVTQRSAVLNGSVAAKKQKTVVMFEWGKSPKLVDARQVKADNSPVSGAQVNTPFQVDLNGLDPQTTYYYRAVAGNDSGKALGRTLSFETLKVDDESVCVPDGARFLKDPFVEKFTLDNIQDLMPKLRDWTSAQELAVPKVAVAQISGWTTNPKGSQGKDRAEKLYYNNIRKLDNERTFFYKDTALSAWQKSSLKKGYYEVVLYFVDLAERCQ